MSATCMPPGRARRHLNDHQVRGPETRAPAFSNGCEPAARRSASAAESSLSTHGSPCAAMPAGGQEQEAKAGKAQGGSPGRVGCPAVRIPGERVTARCPGLRQAGHRIDRRSEFLGGSPTQVTGKFRGEGQPARAGSDEGVAALTSRGSGRSEIPSPVPGGAPGPGPSAAADAAKMGQRGRLGSEALRRLARTHRPVKVRHQFRGNDPRQPVRPRAVAVQVQRRQRGTWQK
jgi:hypothetical protein